MKKYKFNSLKFIALLVIVVLLSACSSARDKNEDSFVGGSSPETPPAVMDEEKESADIAQGDKVISTYYMTLETMDFDNTRKDLDTIIEKHKSFVENSNIGFRGYEYSKNYRYGDFSVRVPKENLNAFKDEIKTIGNVTQENTDKNDVTKYYRDNESRLKLVTSKEKRLLELLEKAVKIEDIIAIEAELTDTIYEKEMLEGDLKSIDEKIDYTTLNLSFIEVRNYSNVEGADSSLWIRFKNAFKDSLLAFKLALENFIIWIVFALPYLIIIVPLIILAIFIIRKFRRNS
nr:DUF4349 domain-containing protein [Tissierella sp.]